jgi:hypothetical protein
MSIENIQKKRFLETIYKIYYSLGSEPSTEEISSIYGRYFSRFKPGQPIPVPFNDLNASSYVDIDKLNRILVHTGFNLDVLYEDYHEELEQLYELVSAFKFRIDNLKSRRAELEKTVDDYLFSINNTDGYYFAFTEAFNNTNHTDLNNTTAIVDTLARKASLPKETSGLFNYVGNILNKVSNAKVDLYLDGQTKISQQNTDFSNVFNGLNNSEWSMKYESSTIGICTLKINVPVTLYNTETSGISVVEGRINSQKPVETSILVIDPIDRSKSLFFTKDSATDYDNFSFNFSTKKTSMIEIYLTKVEPDYVSDKNGQIAYIYDFRIEELIITAPYYSSSAIYVSKSIGLPNAQNPDLAIDEVVFDAEQQVPPGTAINYYVAVDNGSSTDINSFNWIGISPSSEKNSSQPSIIDFKGTRLVESSLDKQTGTSIDSTFDSMIQIPRTTTYNNPIQAYFYQNDALSRNFNVYRLCKFPKNSEPYEPYILESVTSNQIQVSYVTGTALDRTTWQEVISGTRNDIVYTTAFNSVESTQEFYQAQSVPFGSIYLTTNVFMDKPLTITKNFLKSLDAQYWDVNVYLNGIELSNAGMLAPGILSSSLTWNFNKGQNTILIIINKSTNTTNGIGTSFNGSISLMENQSLLTIPNAEVYRNYLSYVKIEDLRNRYSNNDNVFSIIDYENNKEIVYRRTEEIKDGSKVYYFANNQDRPQFIKLRADFFRGSDSYSSPALNSYTLKFKH